jgi:RNA polymerase primary sigma factor
MAPRKTRMSVQALPLAHEASLDIYLRQIANNAPLSSKEEASLAARIHRGDRGAFKKLVLANLRFVVSVSHKYMNQGLPVSDLINEGNMGLLRAATRFDEKKNFRFISYAVWWIRQAILQALAEQSRIVRLPLNRVGSICKIDLAQKTLQQRNHRTASAREIGNELGMKEHDVAKMMQVAMRHASLDAPAVDGTVTLYDRLPDAAANTVEDAMHHDSLSRELGRSLGFLDEREREVVSLYFGVGHDTAYTLDEIGRRYDLTRERIRQIKENALRKLKRPSINRGLRDFAQLA